MKEHYIAHSTAATKVIRQTLCVLTIILQFHDPNMDISVYGGEGVNQILQAFDIGQNVHLLGANFHGDSYRLDSVNID